jgi:hypothetical protein
MYMRKSSAADGTARGWVVVATGVTFIVLVHTGVSDWLTAPAPSELGQMYFGEFTSFKPGDVYNTIIIGSTGTSINVTRLGSITTASNGDPATSGHYVVRGGDGLGTSKSVGKRPLYDPNNRSAIGQSGYPAFPDIISGEMVVSPIGVLESAVGGLPCWRGILPGLWAPLHALPASHGDTLSGSGATAGKGFQLCNVADFSTSGRALLEISDTW